MADVTVIFYHGQDYTLVASPRGHTTLREITSDWQAKAFAHMINAEYREHHGQADMDAAG